jgi:hypothetical protein
MVDLFQPYSKHASNHKCLKLFSYAKLSIIYNRSRESYLAIPTIYKKRRPRASFFYTYSIVVAITVAADKQRFVPVVIFS